MRSIRRIFLPGAWKQKWPGRICAVMVFLVLSWLCLLPCEAADSGERDTWRFLAGNASVQDKDACVFVILGDGFREEEQGSFFTEATRTAEYILATSPYRENRELFKFYGVFEASEESGVRGDTATSLQEALADKRDTFYHSSYWTDGVQRLLALPEEEEKKAQLIAGQFVPEVDFCIVLVNAETYGGSGGEVCVASLHADAMEIVLHELGHTIAGLGDEYWPGVSGVTETPNTTAESDPARVPWAELVGENGIGVYPLGDESTGWYKPSKDCKMQTLGKEHDFCAVCKAALTNAFLQHSNVQAVKNRRFLCGIAAVAGALLFGGVFWTILQKKKKMKKHKKTY